jgi:hypothetical protein
MSDQVSTKASSSIALDFLKGSKYGLRTDHLWIAAILIAAIIPLSAAPIHPHDFWWHLKIGELIFSSHKIPNTQIFSWTLDPNFPYTYGAWLAELTMYLLYRLGQLPLVIFARNLLALISYGLVGYESHRRTGSWRLAAVFVLALHILNLGSLTVRPQIFSWLFFPIFFILLSKFRDGQIHHFWLLTLPGVMILWVNFHGAFVLGVVLIGIFFTGELISRILNLKEALPWRRIRWLGFIGALTLISMLANPHFLGIFGYVIDLMSDPPSQNLVIEWQSPTPSGFTNTFFYLTIILLIIVVAYSKHRLKPTEILLSIAFLWLAWNGKRYLVWYGMAVMPILAETVSKLPIKTYLFPLKRNLFNTIILLILAIPLILTQPWFIEKLPLPDIYWKRVIKDSGIGPLVSNKTPVNAVKYLSENPGGRLFNDMGYGSYMIWAIPDQNVFIDTRVELYPFEQWQDYVYTISGLRYNEILDKYGVNRILLSKESQEELSYQLKNDSNWEKEYEDNFSEVWIKKFDIK